MLDWDTTWKQWINEEIFLNVSRNELLVSKQYKIALIEKELRKAVH